MVWRNQNIILYHGTHTVAMVAIDRMQQFSLGVCRANTDFGTGIYTTTNKIQAEEWAQRAAFGFNKRNEGAASQAHTMEFHVAPEDIATLQSIIFVRSTSEYWELVRHCRERKNHERTGTTQWYDLVAGLVANFDLKSTKQGFDQLSFHTPNACAVLYNSLVRGEG